MTFFCLVKVFPWIGSWTLFLMTAGCCEEHCWAGWKWNDHQWEHLLFSWHDLQHKAWGYEKNIQSCFQQLQNGGVAKSHNSEHHLDANASNAMWITVICNYLQSGAEVSTQVGFWKQMESVDSSHNPHWSSWWAAAFVKDRCWRSLWRPVFHGRDPTMGQWKSVRSPAPEEEAVAGTMCDEMTTDSISQIPAPLAGWKYRKLGVKLSLGRREAWEERCF